MYVRFDIPRCISRRSEVEAYLLSVLDYVSSIDLSNAVGVHIGFPDDQAEAAARFLILFADCHPEIMEA